MKKIILQLLSILLLLGNVVCDLPPEDDLKNCVDEYNLNDLLEAPEELTIGKNQFFLDTYMWRDFMPISPPNGQPLIAVVWLFEKDSLIISETLELNHMWVINNNDIWEGDLKDEGNSEQQRYRIVRVARDGPKWEPNIYVDVVVLVKSDGNKCALIKANNQIIHRTD